MLRFVVLVTVAILIALALSRQLVPALTWVLAFLSLVMLGDLIRSEFRKFWRRAR